MKLTEEQYELIEAYLKNELSASDRALFDTDLRADTELRAEVERQRDLKLGLRAIGIERALDRARAQYRASVTAPEQTPGWQPTIVRPLPVWRYWAVAASLLLVLGIGYYAYQQTTGGQTALAHADGLPDELTKDFPTAALPPASQTFFLEALTRYRAGKYAEVIEGLITLPADRQTLYYKNYLLGLSYVANKQPAQAIPLLTKAMATSSAPLRQKVAWCLALAYVKNGQNSRARPLLEQISTDRTHPFQVLAQRVLKKIGG